MFVLEILSNKKDLGPNQDYIIILVFYFFNQGLSFLIIINGALNFRVINKVMK